MYISVQLQCNAGGHVIMSNASLCIACLIMPMESEIKMIIIDGLFTVKRLNKLESVDKTSDLTF